MIHWNVSPEFFSVAGIHLRWYGLLFMSGLLAGRLIIKDMYDFDTYLVNPLRILKIWEGGLASHGAVIGIILSLWLYYRKHRELSFLSLLDRVAVPVPLAGALIRTGNLFNSEIIGKPTQVAWAFVFSRVDLIPRHPTQICESISYLCIFACLYFVYWMTQVKKAAEFIFGLFLVSVFAARFILEFFKEPQEAFESSLLLNLGQLLSIPLILIGLTLLFRAALQLKVPRSF